MLYIPVTGSTFQIRNASNCNNHLLFCSPGIQSRFQFRMPFPLRLGHEVGPNPRPRVLELCSVNESSNFKVGSRGSRGLGLQVPKQQFPQLAPPPTPQEKHLTPNHTTLTWPLMNLQRVGLAADASDVKPFPA